MSCVYTVFTQSWQRPLSISKNVSWYPAFDFLGPASSPLSRTLDVLHLSQGSPSRHVAQHRLALVPNQQIPSEPCLVEVGMPTYLLAVEVGMPAYLDKHSNNSTRLGRRRARGWDTRMSTPRGPSRKPAQKGQRSMHSSLHACLICNICIAHRSIVSVMLF